MKRNCPCCRQLEIAVLTRRALCEDCDERFFELWLIKDAHESIIDVLVKCRTEQARIRRSATIIEFTGLRQITKNL